MIKCFEWSVVCKIYEIYLILRILRFFNENNKEILVEEM